MPIRNGQIVVVLCIFVGIILLNYGVAAKDSVTQGDTYSIQTTTEQVKSKEVVVFTIRPKGGTHCNLEYPWKLTFVPDVALSTTSKGLWTKTDAVVYTEDMVQFRIDMPKRTPKGTLTFELKLSMCDDKQCYMKKVKVVI